MTGMPSGCSSAGGPMPESCKQLRRLQRARRDDHLAPRGDGVLASALPIDDARRALSVLHDPRRVGVRLDGEIRAAARRPQVARPRSSSGSRAGS